MLFLYYMTVHKIKFVFPNGHVIFVYCIEIDIFTCEDKNDIVCRCSIYYYATTLLTHFNYLLFFML